MTVVITGASSGIGRATAISFAPATLVPARRASQTDPAVVLRGD